MMIFENPFFNMKSFARHVKMATASCAAVVRMDLEFELDLSLTGAESAVDVESVEKAVESHDDEAEAGGDKTEPVCGEVRIKFVTSFA
ncbi:hypothetical protein Aduo_009073 [Ancylostoma duodenale]